MEATTGRQQPSSVDVIALASPVLTYESQLDGLELTGGEAPEPQARPRTPIVDPKRRLRVADPQVEAASDWPLVSVIVPTLNEALNLPYVFAKLPRSLHEVIVVDGFSTDDTLEVVRVLRPDAKIVLQECRGKGEALRCGFEAATGDVLVMLD